MIQDAFKGSYKIFIIITYSQFASGSICAQMNFKIIKCMEKNRNLHFIDNSLKKYG